MNYTLKFYNTYIAKYKKGGRISKAQEGKNVTDFGTDTLEVDTTRVFNLSKTIADLPTDIEYINADSTSRDSILNKAIEYVFPSLKLSKKQSREISTILNKRADMNKANLEGVDENEIYNIISKSEKSLKAVKPKWQARTSNLIKKDMENLFAFDEGIYKVQNGDTPWGIAKAADMSLNLLKEYNPNMVDDEGKWKTIYVGDQIHVINPNDIEKLIPSPIEEEAPEGSGEPDTSGVSLYNDELLTLDEGKEKEGNNKDEYIWVKQPSGKGLRVVKKR